MTLASTLTKLQALNRGSSGIATAPTAYPTALNAADLPCALTLVGAGDCNEQAVGLKRTDTMYHIITYVKPVAHGVGIDEGVQVCLPILQAMINTYLDNPTLDGTIDHIGEQGEFSHSGIQSGDSDRRLIYGGTSYHGFIVSLRITEKTSS